MLIWRSESSLAAVSIGNSVTAIGDSAFEGCSSLAAITIGDSVTAIGGLAFVRCSLLSAVSIGKSITAMGEHAFFSWSSLATVTIPDTISDFFQRHLSRRYRGDPVDGGITSESIRAPADGVVCGSG